MNEDGSRGPGMTSEASRMLEAALEQMDGIIQGARYELPQFENFSIQVNRFQNIQISKYSDFRIYKFQKQVYKYTDLRIYRFKNIQI